jgi:tetratricopeptide (TPR) repeat protein
MMERCDFASIAAAIRSDLLDGSFDNQMEFMEALFSAYLEETETYLDMGLVSRWLNGLAKPSPAISSFYQDHRQREELAITIEDAILPSLSDSAMVVQNIHALLLGDTSISDSKKAELCRRYPCKDKTEEAAFLTDVFLFGLSRPFVARDIRKPNLLPSGSLSPILADFVIDGGVPKTCRYFCGRENELAALHDALIHNGKVYLQGIPGIGKSELAKAYAKEHKKEYTNILYLSYTGDLKTDIANLIFADDLPEDDLDTRFRKHNRFLRSLKDDNLLIVDNFNTNAMSDPVLDIVLKYRCRVLFTTRSNLSGLCCLPVEEISDSNVLFQLVSRFYSGAEQQREVVEQIIEIVHRHTLAVELAARLLETGILEPEKVLAKLREEHASFDATDKISVSKDGKSTRATYYDHIHTLFALFRLATAQREIMQSMTLIPLTGVPARLFGRWMGFRDLNDVNEMAELGFLQVKPGNRIALHPMMQEVAISELSPSITGCHALLESIRATCQIHGEDVPYYKLMFQTVENALDLAAKDDPDFFLLLMEDVFQYAEKYNEEAVMKRLIDEMQNLLNDPATGSVKDRAILLDCRAACEKNTSKAIKLIQEALTLLPEVNSSNALLVSNLNSNLGGLYRAAKQHDAARKHMETAISILEEYHLVGGHDSITQILNYAVLLNDLGESERGLSGLRKIEHIVRKQNAGSLDHAFILETMGRLNLSLGNRTQAAEHFRRALKIFETVWSDEPELLTAKRQELPL